MGYQGAQTYANGGIPGQATAQQRSYPHQQPPPQPESAAAQAEGNGKEQTTIQDLLDNLSRLQGQAAGGYPASNGAPGEQAARVDATDEREKQPVGSARAAPANSQ